jgi:hypothetical protein
LDRQVVLPIIGSAQTITCHVRNEKHHFTVTDGADSPTGFGVSVIWAGDDARVVRVKYMAPSPRHVDPTTWSYERRDGRDSGAWTFVLPGRMYDMAVLPAADGSFSNRCRRMIVPGDLLTREELDELRRLDPMAMESFVARPAPGRGGYIAGSEARPLLRSQDGFTSRQHGFDAIINANVMVGVVTGPLERPDSRLRD